jgi:hypothetical protein
VDTLKQWQTMFEDVESQLGGNIIEHVDTIVEDCRKMLTLASATLSRPDDTNLKDNFFQARDKVRSLFLAFLTPFSSCPIFVR